MTRFFWYYFLIGFVLLLFSLETAPMIDISGQVPDLVLVFIIFFAQKKGPFYGLLLGFCLGLFLDFFSGELLGGQAFVKMTVGLLVGIISNRLVVYSFQTEIFITFLAMIMQVLVMYIELLLFSNVVTSSYFSGVKISIVYTIILSPIVIFLLNWVYKKKYERF